MIWRRLLASSETTIAQLHPYIQACFDWSGEHWHRFRIHGKDYWIAYLGGRSAECDGSLVSTSLLESSAICSRDGLRRLIQRSRLSVGAVTGRVPHCKPNPFLASCVGRSAGYNGPVSTCNTSPDPSGWPARWRNRAAAPIGASGESAYRACLAPARLGLDTLRGLCVQYDRSPNPGGRTARPIRAQPPCPVRSFEMRSGSNLAARA
jgi:hypothetical protein